MLNLRQIDNKNSTHTIGRFSKFSAPQFRATDSLFGNFGEPLEHGASLLGEGEQDVVDETAPADGTSRGGENGSQFEDSDGALRGHEETTSSIEDIIEFRRTDESIVWSGTHGTRQFPIPLFCATHEHTWVVK